MHVFICNLKFQFNEYVENQSHGPSNTLPLICYEKKPLVTCLRSLLCRLLASTAERGLSLSLLWNVQCTHHLVVSYFTRFAWIKYKVTRSAEQPNMAARSALSIVCIGFPRTAFTKRAELFPNNCLWLIHNTHSVQSSRKDTHTDHNTRRWASPFIGLRPFHWATKHDRRSGHVYLAAALLIILTS